METTKLCHNCMREIPEANYEVHNVHCARNIVLCPACDSPVPFKELTEHAETAHAWISCQNCSKEIEQFKLDGHMKNDCDKRIIPCQFCAIQCSADRLKDHEEYCGARPMEHCTVCNQFILIENLIEHKKSCRLVDKTVTCHTCKESKKLNKMDDHTKPQNKCYICNNVVLDTNMHTHQMKCYTSVENLKPEIIDNIINTHLYKKQKRKLPNATASTTGNKQLEITSACTNVRLRTTSYEMKAPEPIKIPCEYCGRDITIYPPDYMPWVMHQSICNPEENRPSTNENSHQDSSHLSKSKDRKYFVAGPRAVVNDKHSYSRSQSYMTVNYNRNEASHQTMSTTLKTASEDNTVTCRTYKEVKKLNEIYDHTKHCKPKNMCFLCAKVVLDTDMATHHKKCYKTVANLKPETMDNIIIPIWKKQGKKI